MHENDFPWWAALVEVAVEIDQRARTRLFLSQSAPVELTDAQLVVGCGTSRARDWLETNCTSTLVTAGEDCALPISDVTFVLDTSAPDRSAAFAPTTLVGSQPRNSRETNTNSASLVGNTSAAKVTETQLGQPNQVGSDQTTFNARYDFETFVVGPSNRFAHAAAHSIAEDPNSAYNPLLVYGSAGLGKTHLLHAIGGYVTRHDPRRVVRYVTAEAFTTEFIDAVRRKEMGQFKDRYRKCDVLLLDDIHFLEGKDGTQEEFFHTFNTLHQGAGKIVITSDRHPQRFTTFEPRLKSRLEWGLQVDITPPNIETRIAILRLRTELDGLEVPGDVLELIAEHVTENIRQLEGALNRVVAYGSLQQTPLSRDLAAAVLSDFIRSSRSRVTPERVFEVVASGCGVSVEDLLGRSRTRPLVSARHLAMYILRQQTDLSYPDIARVFGGRDHTTVMHAVRKIAALMKERKVVYDQVDLFTQRIAEGE